MRQHRYLCTVGLILLSVTTHLSGAAFYIIQKDVRYVQTSSVAPSSPSNFDFFATAESADGVTPLPFNSGSVTGPGSPSNLPLTYDGVHLQFASGVIDMATFNMEFPTGSYTFDITDGVNSASQTVSDSAPESFPPIPFITNFNSLAGLDPTKAFTFDFNAEGPHNATGLLEFLVIRDAVTLNTVVFDGLQPDVTQDTIGPNILHAGTQYQYILFFTKNIVGTNTQLSLNNRTSGLFTTAAGVGTPEPSTLVLVIVGIGCALFLRMRRVTVAI